WQPLPNSEEITTYFPIRVKQTIKATLNNCKFIITVVVNNKDNNIFLLGYMCQCNKIIGITNDLTNAISEVYSKIFATKIRYSGSLIMGWNDENIVNELNKDIPFTPHSFLLEKIKVFVYGVGYSTNMDWHCTGLGYKSSLLHKFGDKQALFVSKIEETLCTVKIYQDQKLQTTYVSNNPIDV
ncbi:10411_t:CDS:1, partial [Funneliformis mosseae]